MVSMIAVRFTVTTRYAADIDRLWDELIDWEGHGRWVPATKVRLLEDTGGVGTRFVARTGFGPLGFDDTMTVTELDAAARRSAVEKTGPLLTGTAWFTLTPVDGQVELHWVEDVALPGPSFLTPVVGRIAGLAGAAGFRAALARLAKQLRHEQAVV
jgi:hypothetical protein